MPPRSALSAYGLWRLARFVSGKVLPKTAYPVLRGPLKGTRFVLGSAAGYGGGARTYFNLVEPEKTRAFINIVGAGQVLFDIGANVGYYTLLGSRLVGEGGIVLAFEPAIRNLFYLYRHIAVNKVGNVTIIPAACSNQLAIADFTVGDSCAEGHLDQRDNLKNYNPQNRMIVPTVTVDEVVKHTNIFPNVLKIDVEGAEFEVLQGAHHTLINAQPIILLGVHSPDLRSACVTYLTEIGYACEAVCGDDQGDVELLATRAQPAQLSAVPR
jgi:FkbM family methyltransferase